MISFFDEKCLRALQKLPPPWRVPQAATAWRTDCVDAQEIISRLIQAGWIMMTHPGHYRLTRLSEWILTKTTLSSPAPDDNPPGAIEWRTRQHLLTTLAAAGVGTTQSLSRQTGQTEHAVRKMLHRLADHGMVTTFGKSSRYQEWAVTELGIATMQEWAAEEKNS